MVFDKVLVLEPDRETDTFLAQRNAEIEKINVSQ